MKFVLVLFLMATPVSAESLLVQTENGTVSVVKDLDAKTCKQMACRLRLQTSCFPAACDEDGNTVYGTTIGNSCMRSVQGSDPKLVECLK